MSMCHSRSCPFPDWQGCYYGVFWLLLKKTTQQMFWLISSIITTVIICMVALQVIMLGSFFPYEYVQIFQKQCPGFMQECNFFVGNGACLFCLAYLFHCHPSHTTDHSNYWALRQVSPTQAYCCNLSDALVSFTTYISVILTLSLSLLGLSANKYAGYLQCLLYQKCTGFLLVLWIKHSLM